MLLRLIAEIEVAVDCVVQLRTLHVVNWISSKKANEQFLATAEAVCMEACARVSPLLLREGGKMREPGKEVVICLEGENLLLVNLNSLLLCHVNLNLMLALILTSSTPYPVPRYCYSVHFQRYSHLRDLVKMRIIVSPPRLLYSGTLCGHCIM